MDVEQNPLLKLEPDKQQQLVDLVQNGDVEAVANATGMSRRSVILAAAALGVGTIGGGVTAQELIQEAQAQASTTDSDGNVGTPSNPVDVFADGISSNSVNTDEGQITNETFIRGIRNNDSSSTSAGAVTNIFDAEAKDVRGELNSNQEFVPDKDGEYVIIGTVGFGGNTSSGDQVNARVQGPNGTVGTRVRLLSPGAADTGLPVLFSVSLTAGNAYKVQAWNFDSSYTITTNTEATIRRSVVQ